MDRSFPRHRGPIKFQHTMLFIYKKLFIFNYIIQHTVQQHAVHVLASPLSKNLGIMSHIPPKVNHRPSL